MTEWINFGIGWLFVAAFTLWVRKFCKRVQRRFGWSWLTDDSNPPVPKSDPGHPEYQEQAAKCIYDVSTTLSQAHLILSRLEPILETLEKILPQVRDELVRARNRPVAPFMVERGMEGDSGERPNFHRSAL